MRGSEGILGLRYKTIDTIWKPGHTGFACNFFEHIQSHAQAGECVGLGEVLTFVVLRGRRQHLVHRGVNLFVHGGDLVAKKKNTIRVRCG
jgi:hypothetical protein